LYNNPVYLTVLYAKWSFKFITPLWRLPKYMYKHVSYSRYFLCLESGKPLHFFSSCCNLSSLDMNRIRNALAGLSILWRTFIFIDYMFNYGHCTVSPLVQFNTWHLQWLHRSTVPFSTHQVRSSHCVIKCEIY